MKIVDCLSKARFALATRARKKRGRALIELIARCSEIDREMTILDVGGRIRYWEEIGYAPPLGTKIVILNLPDDLPAGPVPQGFELVAGDATDLSRYGEGQFQLVVSNSVIGHVHTGGRPEARRCMADGIRRIGRAYYVQTPNRAFPIDWRTGVVGFHWKSHEEQARILARRNVGGRRCIPGYSSALGWVNSIHHLDQKEMAMLFSDGYFSSERFGGFIKSLIVIREPIVA
ncbi:MAG TPA: hypothetical protein VHD69_01650 [Candidatus Paceibacterota bacterium]|nr:hypothetical protein [Candidatus Paceibacterota bacterium]